MSARTENFGLGIAPWGSLRGQAAPEILGDEDRRVRNLTPGPRRVSPGRGETELSASRPPHHPPSAAYSGWIHRSPTPGPFCPGVKTRPEPCSTAITSWRGPLPGAHCTQTQAEERLCVCRNEGLFCQSLGHARDTRSRPPAAPHGHSGLRAPSRPPPAGRRLCSVH